MADNSNLFRKRPVTPPWKRVEVASLAGTYPKRGRHTAVVLIQQESKLYLPLLLESFANRGDALQHAHYINNNKVRREDGEYPNTPMPEGTLAELREEGYEV